MPKKHCICHIQSGMNEKGILEIFLLDKWRPPQYVTARHYVLPDALMTTRNGDRWQQRPKTVSNSLIYYILSQSMAFKLQLPDGRHVSKVPIVA